MPEISITVLLIPFAAYLLGSIPLRLLLAKLFGGTDVRKAAAEHRRNPTSRASRPAGGNSHAGLRHAKGAAAVWLAGV